MKSSEGYLGRLFGQVSPEHAALQPMLLPKLPKFVFGEVLTEKSGLPTKADEKKWRRKVDPCVAPWAFNGHHLVVKVVNYYYPEPYRRKAAAYYKKYDEVPPPEFTFYGVRAKSFKDADVHFWNGVGGVPEPVRKLVIRHCGYYPVEDKQCLPIKREAWRQGSVEFLRRSPSKLLPRLMSLACFMSQVWDSLRLGLQYAGVHPTALRRSILMEALLVAPEQFALQLKRDAATCRANAFNQSELKCGLVTEMDGMKGLKALRFSMLGRSLPAPMTPDPSTLESYLNRMTSEPPEIQPEIWLQDWFRNHMPAKLKHLGFTIGTSSCVEFSRADGGIPAVCAVLVALGHQENNGDIKRIFSHYDGLSPSQLGITQIFWAEGENGIQWPIAYKWRCLLYGALLVCEALQREQVTPAAYVIEAPEKGLKTRVPTAGIAPVVVLQHCLRAYVDQFMVNDCRIGPSITPGDAMRTPIIPPDWEDQDYHLRSLDATTATDRHPFAWQRAIYTELFKYLPETEWFNRLKALIPILCGPRYLTTQRACGHPKLMDVDPPPIWWQNLPPGIKDEVRKYAKFVDKGGDGSFWPEGRESHILLDEDDFTRQYRFWPGMSQSLREEILESITQPGGPAYAGVRNSLSGFIVPLEDIVEFHRNFQREGILTSVGAMMGEPTSWPGLSLMNVMTWELAIPFERWYHIRTTGDDALAYTTVEEDQRWNQILAQHGVSISLDKDYASKLYGLYTEVITGHNGEPIGIAPLSTLAGPFGGSKGTIHWAACPAHTQIVVDRVNAEPFARRFFRTSRFWPQLVAAHLLHLPLNFPLTWGGIDLDSNVMLSRLRGAALRKWANHLGNLSMRDIVMNSASLAIVKGPKFGPTWEQVFLKASELEMGTLFPNARIPLSPSQLKKMNEKMYNGILKQGAEQITNKLLSVLTTAHNKDPALKYRKATELTQQFQSFGAVAELLNGRRAETGEKEPSVIRAAHKFFRTLRPKDSRFPLKIGIRALIKSVDEKRERFIPQPLGSLAVFNVVEDNARTMDTQIAPREFPGRKYRS
jgi:hypothetical protein